MNLTVAAWLAVVAALGLGAWVRPAYAVALYMMTFFANPRFWWWGDIVEDYRWNFFAGVLLLVTIIATKARAAEAMKPAPPLSSNAAPIVALIVINLLVVHFMFAANSEASLGWMISRLKFILLFFLLQYSIRDEKDFRIVALATCLGMAYIGYETTINERGSFSGGRLEGVGAAGVQSSNQLASLFSTALPIAVTVLFTQVPKWVKAIVLAGLGLTFNVVLMCNSRGAFLGLIVGGIAFMLMASGPARKKALKLAAVAALGAFLLLGDPEIVQRFGTTFTSEGQRDNSAQSRIQFWTSASQMLRDYPFGSGGNSFSEGRGWRYMRGADRGPRDTRAIHNGWITEATDWGIQGVSLMMLFILAAMRTLLRGRRLALAAGDSNAVMVYGCIMAGILAWMVSSIFGDYLNDEWGFWILAMGYAYLRVRTLAPAAAAVPAGGAAAQTGGGSAAPFSPIWPRPVVR